MIELWSTLISCFRGSSSWSRTAGARTLYYSGGDLDTDWLRGHLEARNFLLHSTLRSYDKEDFSIPDEGNTHLLVRQFEPADAPATVAVEDLAFEQLWRHDAASFLEVRRYYPYFVVAVDAGGIVGYQYNTVEAGMGYLVRIAVHPRVEGQGIGTRLMAEAVRYFQGHRVEKIVLNADAKNHRAQSLYRRFGFHQVYSRGFVLERSLVFCLQFCSNLPAGHRSYHETVQLVYTYRLNLVLYL